MYVDSFNHDFVGYGPTVYDISLIRAFIEPAHGCKATPTPDVMPESKALSAFLQCEDANPLRVPRSSSHTNCLPRVLHIDGNPAESCYLFQVILSYLSSIYKMYLNCRF